MQQFYHDYVLNYLLRFCAALIILAAGTFIAYIIRRFLHHGIKLKNNEVPKAFLTNLVFAAVMLVTFIMALAKIGVPTATLITVLGAGSLAIGLALKDFLSNIAAGFMIIFLRPFKIGDYIIVNGTAGTIININLFMTQLKSATNECVFVPNTIITDNPIVNQSYYHIRRLDVEIGVDYGTDLKKAKSLLEKMLFDFDFVAKEETVIIGVSNLADSSIVILVRFWVRIENYTTAKYQFLEAVNQKFSEEKISLPFPQLDVHIKNDQGTTL